MTTFQLSSAEFGTILKSCIREWVKLVLKNVIKLAKDSLNNIFQNSFNTILSQQLSHVTSYISVHVLCDALETELIKCISTCFIYLLFAILF